MTDVKVVDASAVAALLFGEPEAEAVVRQLGNCRLVAPALFGFELAKLCLVKSRRHPQQRSALKAAFELRHRLNIVEAAIDHDDILALATRTKLTTYDASYLWLALQLGAELVTLDPGLATADASSRA